MRVIRTEMFFEEVDDIGPAVSEAAKMNPGIGIAFFNAAVGFPFHGILKKPILYDKANDREVRRFLDLSVRGIERSYGRPHSKYWQADIRNVAIVDYILNANIVVEQSPPEWASFKTLVSKSPGIAIGTFVGSQWAGTHPELMIVTVPIGILVVSSAIGVSEALKNGLNKKLESFFTGKTTSATRGRTKRR
jgi:hypothetical protein